MSSPEMLDITGPQGVSFRLAFSDRYLETPVIQLNQVGYNPRATERWAYVSAFLGDGGFLDLSAIPSHAEVLAEAVDPTMPREVVLAALPVTSRSTQDKDAGGAVKEINLASLPAAEDLRYRVRLPGVGVSWPTEVSERAASKAFVTVTRGLLYNRWGGPTELVCNQWGRPADHATVYTAELGDFLAKFPSTQPKVGERRLEGGYHDAGDFDQRPMHTVVPQLLLRAFEMDPERYTDGQLNLPESGNGIPDLLDEALWGVAAWEQLQEADGGVRMGVESHRHPWGFYLAHTDPLPYWTYSRCPKVSARAAGLFAQASRLLAPFDSSRAANLRERAVKAYAYAKSMGGAKAYLLFGAGELYRLTGQDSYRQDFEAQWAAMGSYGVFSNFSTTHLSQADYGNGNRAMGDFILAYLGSQGASSAMRSTTITNLDKFSNEVSSRIRSSHAHRSPRPANYNWDWGQGTHTARYMDPIVSRLQIGGLSAAKQQEYFNTMSLAADYVLGGNPDGRVYFTGLGSRPAEEPLHLDSLVFAKMGRGPVPGIPVYGPVEGLPAASYMAATKAAFHPSVDQLPRAMRFGDVRTLVNNTEFTVWESQAPFAQLFAMLSGPDA
jgi:endoglucanase